MYSSKWVLGNHIHKVSPAQVWKIKHLNEIHQQLLQVDDARKYVYVP